MTADEASLKSPDVDHHRRRESVYSWIHQATFFGLIVTKAAEQNFTRSELHTCLAVALHRKQAHRVYLNESRTLMRLLPLLGRQHVITAHQLGHIAAQAQHDLSLRTLLPMMISQVTQLIAPSSSTGGAAVVDAGSNEVIVASDQVASEGSNGNTHDQQA